MVANLEVRQHKGYYVDPYDMAFREVALLPYVQLRSGRAVTEEDLAFLEIEDSEADAPEEEADEGSDSITRVAAAYEEEFAAEEAAEARSGEEVDQEAEEELDSEAAVEETVPSSPKVEINPLVDAEPLRHLSPGGTSTPFNPLLAISEMDLLESHQSRLLAEADAAGEVMGPPLDEADLALEAVVSAVIEGIAATEALRSPLREPSPESEGPFQRKRGPRWPDYSGVRV